MARIIRWRERLRQARETPWGETRFEMSIGIPTVLLIQVMMNGVSASMIIGTLIGSAVVTGFTLAYYRIRGTTRPLWRTPPAVDVLLLVAVLLGAHLLLNPPLWQTGLLGALGAVWIALHYWTIPHAWRRPHQARLADGPPIAISKPLKSG